MTQSKLITRAELDSLAIYCEYLKTFDELHHNTAWWNLPKQHRLEERCRILHATHMSMAKAIGIEEEPTQ